MLSNSSKYAIKAVLYLALNSDENDKVMVKDIAKQINVPMPYLAKLLQELSKQKIISSVRGPKGGFFLSNTDRKNSVMSIVSVIDGEHKFYTCLLSLENCNEKKPCPMHNTMTVFRTKFIQSLQDVSISEMVLQVESGEAYLPL